MMHVHTISEFEYAVCFDTMRVFKTHKIKRIAQIIPVEFVDYQFRAELPTEVLFYLLPLYEKFLSSFDKREEGKRLAKFLNYDLNDLAARNFNSFTGGKGE